MEQEENKTEERKKIKQIKLRKVRNRRARTRTLLAREIYFLIFLYAFPPSSCVARSLSLTHSTFVVLLAEVYCFFAWSSKLFFFIRLYYSYGEIGQGGVAHSRSHGGLAGVRESASVRKGLEQKSQNLKILKKDHLSGLELLIYVAAQKRY